MSVAPGTLALAYCSIPRGRHVANRWDQCFHVRRRLLQSRCFIERRRLNRTKDSARLIRARSKANYDAFEENIVDVDQFLYFVVVVSLFPGDDTEIAP